MTNYLGPLVIHIKASENYFFQSTNDLEEVKGLLVKILQGEVIYSELQCLFKYNILGREGGGPRLFTTLY